jgi:CBS domain-containing protein
MTETVRARDVMTESPGTLRPEQPLLEAAGMLFDRRWAGAPVLDPSGRVVGVLTLADVIATKKELHPPQPFVLFDALLYLGSARRFEHELRKVSAMTVADAMSSPARTIAPDAPISDVAAMMVDERLSTVPVVDGGRLVGVVGRRDVVGLVLGRKPSEAKGK